MFISRKVFYLLIFFNFFAYAQTSEQIRQAKDIIKKTGMTESQARTAAKAKGFTDKQIDNAIKKERGINLVIMPKRFRKE